MDSEVKICKHCDGTGTSNWCINGTFLTCEYCNGTGIETKEDEEGDCYETRSAY